MNRLEMSPKQGSGGMISYAQGKSHAEAKHRSGSSTRSREHDDLKMGLPRTTNIPKGVDTDVSRFEATHRHLNGDQADASRQMNGQKPFYGTDASSIGDTSDTPNARRMQPVQPSAVQTTFTTNAGQAVQPHIRFSENDFDDHEEDSEAQREHLLNNPLYGNLTEVAKGIDQEIKAELASRKVGASLAYMKGDSYPSTTSGPPSMHHPDDRQSLQMKREHAVNQTAPPTRSYDQPYTLGPHPPQHQNRSPFQPQGLSRQPQPQLSNSRFEWPKVAEQTMQHDDANDFAFAAHNRAGTNGKPPANTQRPHQIVAERSRQPLTDMVAPEPPLSKVERTHRQPVEDLRTRAERLVPQVHTANATDVGKAARPSNGKPPEAVPFATQTPAARPAEDDGEASESGHGEHKLPPEDREEGPDFDYDVPGLYHKTYADLKSQPFDIDPRHESKVFATDDPIDRQIAAAAALAPKDQHALVTSLAIDEWEEAGVWFLGKFGETLAKLKSVRQERRKAAREFESEVEKRHVAVTKKRKLTESALADMRTSGSMVLDGTPKKGKNTK